MSGDHFRVSFTPGTISGIVRSRQRRECDGHLNRERHYIEQGEECVANALPPDHPDIGNTRWWHTWFCMDCCPTEYAEAAS